MDRVLPALHADLIGALPYETPFFLISRDVLLKNLQVFRECFPGAAIHYAVKANADIELLRILAEAGCNFEAASRYELQTLLDSGVAPAGIIYGTSVKAQSHIREFHRHGVDRFAFDSLGELEKIA